MKQKLKFFIFFETENREKNEIKVKTFPHHYSNLNKKTYPLKIKYNIKHYTKKTDYILLNNLNPSCLQSQNTLFFPLFLTKTIKI